MTFQFKPAIRTETSLLIAIAGASGSGKTMSALRLASGLAGGKPFAVIDTESGRALHYANRFKFEHGDLRAPFRPQNYTDAIVAAEAAGYPVIVIDSMSHEYDGEGGISDWAAELEKSNKPPKNWTIPKQAHKRMVGRMLQSRAHLIFCLRAEDKIKITKDANGKMVIIQPADIPVRERWIPICEKRFMYEMTVSMVVTPDAPGVPIPIKLQEQHKAAFYGSDQIDEKVGEALAKWARGQEIPVDPPDEKTLELAREAARGGSDVFATWWRGASQQQRRSAKSIEPEIAEIRKTADKEQAERDGEAA